MSPPRKKRPLLLRPRHLLSKFLSSFLNPSSSSSPYDPHPPSTSASLSPPSPNLLEPSALLSLSWRSSSFRSHSSSFRSASFRSSSFRSLAHGYSKLDYGGGGVDGGFVLGESFRLGDKGDRSNSNSSSRMSVSMASIPWQAASSKVKVACGQVLDAALKTSPHVTGLFQGNQILLHFTPAGSFPVSSATTIFPSSGLLQERH